MQKKPDIDELFENRIAYPDADIQERLERLVGIDAYKKRLVKILGLLINPSSLEGWAKKYHSSDAVNVAKKIILNKPPLIIFEGDVGSGKTELAETIGDAVARLNKIDIMLFPLSLATRGQGRVGEMTQLISTAFDYTLEEAKKNNSNGQVRQGVILVIDEADAIAQSRELTQMHHEDRAGVNALIRGIDAITHAHLPIAIIMCTNRLNALDPAIKRRATDILTFSRPNEEQGAAMLFHYLKDFGFTQDNARSISKEMGTASNKGYGFTYSDIVQRLLPAIIIDAYPQSKIEIGKAIDIAKNIEPTPPFKDKT